MTNFIGKIGGRKFLMALFGATAIALHNWLGIDQDSILALGGVVCSYVLGQGLADGMSGGETSSVAQSNRPTL